ncbi:MAG TPA: hypothetical protein PLC84_02620 [Methanosarcina thermophila]|nr:hypothetical protein [Methanosarcina thermophila]HPZ19196.1 hypothetical protein [Methanosarcina thermophila]
MERVKSILSTWSPGTSEKAETFLICFLNVTVTIRLQNSVPLVD